jgi:hypothetical protein
LKKSSYLSLEITILALPTIYSIAVIDCVVSLMLSASRVSPSSTVANVATSLQLAGLSKASPSSLDLHVLQELT